MSNQLQVNDPLVPPRPVLPGNSLTQPLSQQIEMLASQSNLTVGQLLLWLGQKLNPALPLYNMVFSFTITGDVDRVHFQHAFQALVDRSDVLRLTITESAGVPHQQVRQALRYPLPYLDFASAGTPQSMAQQWMRQRCTRRLDLQRCLFDSALLKIAPDQFIWYFNQHHLITDNWSVALLYQSLQDYYGRSHQGTLATAPAIRPYLPYAEQTRAQRPSQLHALSKPSSYQKAIEYWQQKRQTAPPPIPLYGQLYGQSPIALSARTERIYCELGEVRSQALRALAATPAARSLSRHQSLFNLFLTLLFAYLYRVSGRCDLAIAAPAHNRPTPADKETPGVFIELFPLQMEIAPGATFLSLLEQVKQESMAFLRYAQSGLSHHAMDRNMNVVLSYINVTFGDFHQLPTHTEWLHSGAGDPQHHLRLEVHDFDATGNFTLQFDFNCDLIPEVQRQWAPEQFCQLLDAWVADAEQPIATVDMLAAGERSRLLGPRPVREHTDAAQTLVTEFQQQVNHRPHQVAVVCAHQSLTYSELDIQANQLAHYLRQQGVKPGQIVGLFMERSITMVVGILGILKAGAAYLPLDPTHPAERIQFILQHGQVPFLLMQQVLMLQGLAGQLSDLPARVICVEAAGEAIAQQPTQAPQLPLTAQDLAYILYTSGSTGQPKGVMVEHRNVLALLQGFEQTAPVEKPLRGAAVCSYGFDVSVWELFSNLCFGGTLHLVPSAVVMSSDGLARYLMIHGVTSAYIPPALLPTVIAVWEKETGAIALDRLLVGVEPIPQGLLQRYRQRLPQLRIINGYGPTETTICATFYRFETASAPQETTPIGTAVPGYDVSVVNAQGQRVPIGVKGEIVIGGAGLSRGYLNQPELTAQRFMDNPFGPGKLYKTGDQARYRSDGNLVFLGRFDHQVKIRGFRVELSEVETALIQNPKIQQAVVIAQPTPQGSQTLMAYLVAATAELTSGEIQGGLRQTVPDYMVPSAFIVLEALPVTPNGKLDRRRLASDDYTHRPRLGTTADYVAPSSDWETYLANLWARCLQVPLVGIHDNYFDLGGDSITAIQIAAQATEAGLVLSPQQILQHLTIARLLSQLNPAPACLQDTGAIQDAVPLTPIQQAFFEQTLVDPHHWNQSLLLEVTQPLDPAMLETALQQLLQHHAVLSFQFICGATGWQQWPADTPAQASLQYLDLSPQSALEQAEAVAIAEAQLQTSLDLTNGELMRAALFHWGGDRPDQLLLIIHHLVVDGVSWLAILNDLDSFYRQVQGETGCRPLPTTPFSAWSAGLVTAVAAGTFQAELEYWLTPAQVPLMALPQDRASTTASEPTNTVVSSRTVTTYLDTEETRALLKDLPQTARVQANEVVLTALALSLYRQTGQPSWLVDVEGHGREETIVPGASLVRTVGWFTTVFPLLLTLPLSDLGEQLQSMKQQVRRVPGQGLGYGLLRYLGADPAVTAQLQAQPQAEILFNYLGDLARLLPAESRFRLARTLQLSRSPRGQRRYVLEVTAVIHQGRLQVEWTYSQALHHSATIQAWAAELITALRSLIARYTSPTASAVETPYRPVDFPLANLTAQKLDKISALLNKASHQASPPQ